jgi:hypothetical protein
MRQLAPNYPCLDSETTQRFPVHPPKSRRSSLSISQPFIAGLGSGDQRERCVKGAEFQIETLPVKYMAGGSPMRINWEVVRMALALFKGAA